MAGLRLEAVDFVELNRWRWVLTDESTETAVADHEVRLESSRWQFEAFEDLVGYLSWHAAPDRRVEDEARIVAELGEWIGSQVLGPVGDVMVQASPVTVRVAVPEGAAGLLARPLELAHVGGKPLAIQRVTLVMETGAAAGSVYPVGDRLRVLGLFSLPEGGQALNLHRERHSLIQLFERIAAAGKAVDVRVLQYGVTRDRLREVLADGEGWDVIHISGHGSPGQLLLETGEGRPDSVSEAELAELLGPAIGRLKLVTVSACWSAAVAVAEQRRLLGLPLTTETPPEQTSGPRHPESAAGSLATELADRLGCAVLAMRYPVNDEFAIMLSRRLYRLLADQGQSLPRAVGIALRELASELDSPSLPPLSLATPALFGIGAVDLRLAAPEHLEEAQDLAASKMAGFPPEPEWFVGRTAVMAQASAALAPASGIPGVLLYGMPGGGKSACALELAYGQEHAFDLLVWYKAPDEGVDITGALTDFALSLERHLGGAPMSHVLVSDERLQAFLPCLTQLMEQPLLIVIDNVESLLTDGGEWRDVRWDHVIGALTRHSGPGRVVLTSRRMPAGLTGLHVVPVGALSANEAVLLTSELPNINALKLGHVPGIDRLAARRLARRVLDVAQGHPKLLELAEGQAANPERLAGLVKVADQAWRKRGGLPRGFFASGEATASGEDYLNMLAAWTRSVTEILADGERALFWFLCCLEEADRIRHVAEAVWPRLWNRLELGNQRPDLDETLRALAAHGLNAVQPRTKEANWSYSIHPVIAAAGRAQAGKKFQDAVDTEATGYWMAIVIAATERESENRATGWVVRAGLSASPYLIRQGEWSTAAYALQVAFARHPSRANASFILPALQQIATTGHVPEAALLLADVLGLIDPAAAMRQTRALLGSALGRGDYRVASATAGKLSDQCAERGRLTEALTLAEEAIGYTQRAGLGPWTQLSEEVRRLQVLSAMGQPEHVLAEIQRLRKYMQTLPTARDRTEPANLWDVRETLLHTGHAAALSAGQWDDGLELSAAITASMRDRGAPAVKIAQATLSDYTPLIRTGRTDEALELLQVCRQVFETEHDIQGISKVLGALASLESNRGRGDAAISLGRDALRYSYLAGEVSGISIGHHNLGSSLRHYARQPADALVHHLAAALIGALASLSVTDMAVRSAATDLWALGYGAAAPADVADLCGQLADISGMELDRLLTTLAADPGLAEQALQVIIARVRAQATAPPPEISRQMARWEPVIAALLAADSGDQDATMALDAELARHKDSAGTGTLAAALRGVRAGDAGSELFTGLNEIDAAIMTRALDALNGTVSIPAELWAAMPFGPLLGDLVSGAGGDANAAGRARKILQVLAGDSRMSPLATVLRRILDGDCAPDVGDHLTDPTESAIVATVLHYLGAQ